PAAIHPEERGFIFSPDPNRRLKMITSAGSFQVEPEWQYLVHHPVEAERGLQPTSDLFSPGYFKLSLAGGEEAVIQAQIMTSQERDTLPVATRRKTEVYPPSAASEATRAPATDPKPLLEVLEQAMRQFVVRRGELKTVIAGYPWFLDWGRDTLICARGLIAAGMLEEVGAILKQFANFEKDGTLPNMIQGERADNRDTSDAPLWLIVACADWCRAAGRQDLLNESCGRHTVRQALESVARGYIRGTPNGIGMDVESGLIFSPAHFTWMDTNFPAGSPREGYPIEIQALWQAALTFLAQTGHDPQWPALANRVQESIQRHFWNPQRGFLADCLHAAAGKPAAQATPDDALRPNQLLALTLGAVTDQDIGRQVLAACEELLVPGAIRTLADRPVEFPLPIERAGRLINDPLHPYWGRYEGDEDTRRKPAYHNGTAWTWLFPSFSEAWVQVHGAGGRDAALAWLAASVRIINAGCLGQIPEILDGDYPHRLRGCDAQAWGVTELYRVLKGVE
ncbi:MAG: amylo-alpha-1,6-glucosidase, partial [Kiritimatiellae bacterium]|nr:amylo-alpha-1,6-glucosidase [Kiritimatiellia bacterium]